MHFESIVLGLMGPDDRDDFVFLEKTFGKLKPEKVGTTSNLVGLGNFIEKTIFMVNGISPDEVTEEPRFRNLLEPVNVLNIIQLGYVKSTDCN